jgi:hypothetical protein
MDDSEKLIGNNEEGRDHCPISDNILARSVGGQSKTTKKKKKKVSTF